jgi:AcrR family transcriptional regulator
VATPSRKEREKQRHRQEILAAALRLFAQKGFHNVSMQEIATAAEFATGTLYNFFSSKETLFFELMETSAAEGLDLVLPSLEGPEDERHKLVRFIRLHEQLARDRAETIRLFLLESRGRNVLRPQIDVKKKEFEKQVVSRLSAVIAAGVRKGLFNDVDPQITARCLRTILEEMLLAAVEDPQAGDLGLDLKKVEALFFKGLVKSSRGKRDA